VLESCGFEIDKSDSIASRLIIVQTENDEIMEAWMAPEIQKTAVEKGRTVDFVQARGALHFESITKREFLGWVTAFV
jgi:hypothetical protein